MRRSNFIGTLLTISSLSVGVGVFVASPAMAQSDSEEQAAADRLNEARVMFQRALELEQGKNWSAALLAYREVGQVRMTPQVRYHIATCEEKLGQLVVALGGYELALSESQGMHPDFISDVENSIDDLKARVPKLVIERGDGALAATIQLDGVTLGDRSIGIETPLNPGPHTITASAPGYDSFSETIAVGEGEVEILTITLNQTQMPAPPVRVEPPPPPALVERKYGKLPYVFGGAGLGSLVLGGVLLGVSQGKVGKIKDNCENGGDEFPTCVLKPGVSEKEQDSLYSSAKAIEGIGWAFVGVGAAAVGTGVVLYYLDRKAGKPIERAGLTVQPYAPASDAGFSITGRF